MPDTLVTCDRCQEEISLLNLVAPLNVNAMDVTNDVSHPSMSYVRQQHFWLFSRASCSEVADFFHVYVLHICLGRVEGTLSGKHTSLKSSAPLKRKDMSLICRVCHPEIWP